MTEQAPTVDQALAAIRAHSIETRTDWATAVTYLNGTVRHTGADEEEHVALTADSITTHLASLNEPTRQMNGVDTVAIVNRDVSILPDGTQVIGPWREVRQGRVLENDRG